MEKMKEEKLEEKEARNDGGVRGRRGRGRREESEEECLVTERLNERREAPGWRQRG